MTWPFLCLLSLGITLFSFPPYQMGFLMFVGLIPLFRAADTAPSIRAAFCRVWIAVFVGNAAICAWVAYAVREFTSLPMPLAWGTVLGLSVFEQIAWPVLAALRHYLYHRRGVRPILWTPVAMYALESLIPKVFPNTIGNVLFSVRWLAQGADLAGVVGLSSLLVASNELGALWLDKTIAKQTRMKHSFALGGFIALFLGYAAVRTWQVDHMSPDRHLLIRMVQPNVNSAQQMMQTNTRDKTRRELYDLLTGLSKGVPREASLVIWPETSFPDGYQGPVSPELERFLAGMGMNGRSARDPLSVEMDAFVKHLGVPVLFGTMTGSFATLHNSIVLLRPDGKLQQYDKTRLLLLGETVPFAAYFPTLARWARENGGAAYEIGTGPKIFDVEGVPVGPLICVEGLYHEYVRSIVEKGARVLVSATNDSWYGPGREPWLHLYLTSFRAIENRRPLVRVTNTGISTWIGIDGQLHTPTSLNEKRVIDTQVPVYAEMTSPYVAWGNAWVYLALFVTVLPFLRYPMKPRKVF